MPSPENGRKRLHKIDELAKTLSSDGMNTAMTVIPPDVYIATYPQHKDAVEARVAEGVLFVVHHGHRRLAAALEAGLTEVPILVRRDVPSLRIAAIQENLQRMALNPIEEAMEFQEALDETDDEGRKLSQRDLAKRAGCSQTYVSHRVALLRLVPPLQQAVVNHWLKDQQLLETETTNDDQLLFLPVREAATVYARLRSELQEAFAQGEITASQAAGVSKLPPDQQSIAAAQTDTADYDAIGEAEPTKTPLPEPRGSDSLLATAASAAEVPAALADPGHLEGGSTSRDSSTRDRSSVAHTREEPVAAPVMTQEDPRGVIVVRSVKELALSIMDLLDGEEIESLKEYLSPRLP
ncbi:ParB/RepB/Spo0J family partition protein [Streptomyces sp. NBC_00568]|uniref:ParB/RepB/Spo0J family partition protein n=1 Tax=Streptomyces sp. NBC_00568 TaxID=2975779 RepID=UPI002B1E8EEA|nr:ParB/RepB/Spo0J family partition protein [Streptomyces sp. NBC_00568]